MCSGLRIQGEFFDVRAGPLVGNRMIDPVEIAEVRQCLSESFIFRCFIDLSSPLIPFAAMSAQPPVLENKERHIVISDQVF